MGWVRVSQVMHTCMPPTNRPFGGPPQRGDLWRCEECKTLWCFHDRWQRYWWVERWWQRYTKGTD